METHQGCNQQKEINDFPLTETIPAKTDEKQAEDKNAEENIRHDLRDIPGQGCRCRKNDKNAKKPRSAKRDAVNAQGKPDDVRRHHALHQHNRPKRSFPMEKPDGQTVKNRAVILWPFQANDLHAIPEIARRILKQKRIAIGKSNPRKDKGTNGKGQKDFRLHKSQIGLRHFI
ncbi:MAG: hypothetical protein SFW62_07070 [Alphaproteobacteria bacterium]|nr:hypothetical protein [Alphaproteobacteria bacterium]